jgi:ATP-dependent RNA helicase DHX37/DHR1
MSVALGGKQGGCSKPNQRQPTPTNPPTNANQRRPTLNNADQRQPNPTQVSGFPFPTPPDPDLLRSATRCLTALSALQPAPAAAAAAAAPAAAAQQLREAGGNLTPMGLVMAGFPISPRHSRMVLEAVQWQRQQAAAAAGGNGEDGAVQGGDGDRRKQKKQNRRRAAAATVTAQALPYAVALAAALSLESPFMHVDGVVGDEEEDEGKRGGKGEEDEEEDKDEGEEEDEGEEGGGGGGQRAEKKRRSRERKDAARARRAAAAAAHARFRSDDGDALSVLRALCAYEAAATAGAGRRGGALAAGEAFCRDNFLHARHLKEMSALRRQLMRTLQQQQVHRRTTDPAAAALQAQLAAAVAAAADAGAGDAAAPLPAPGPEVEGALRRALAAGWCDQVAKRVRSAGYVARLMQESGRKK